jgi:hypothetical protein
MFEMKLDIYETVLFESKNGEIVPKHPKIKKVVYGLINMMGKSNTFMESDILVEAATRSWEALHTFELQDNGSWVDVLNGKDAHNLNRLVKAISLKLEHELPMVINPDTRRMYDPETGGTMYVTVDFDSIDAPVFDNEGIKQIGIVGDEVSESFFAPKEYEYIENPFLSWFKGNRHNFLTDRQNEFIDSLMVETAKDTNYVEDCDFRELTGTDRTNFKHLRDRIYARTMKNWQLDGTTRREAYLLGEVAKWSEFINIAESDEDLTCQNEKLSKWIIGKLEADITDFEKEQKNNGKEYEKVLGKSVSPIDLAYDVLAEDEDATKLFVKFLKGEIDSLDSHVLHKIYSAVESHIAVLKQSLEEYEPSVPLMPNLDKKRDNAERKRKYREFTDVQPCKVFNRGGELIMVIDDKEAEGYKLKKLDAYGSLQKVE